MWTKYMEAAELAIKHGKLEKAALVLRQCLSAMKQSGQADGLDVADCMETLAWVECKLGNLNEANRLYMSSLQIKTKLLGNKRTAVAFTLKELADVKNLQGEYAEAERLARTALAIFDKAFGSQSTESRSVVQLLVSLCTWQQRIIEAVQLQRRLQVSA